MVPDIHKIEAAARMSMGIYEVPSLVPARPRITFTTLAALFAAIVAVTAIAFATI